jgi:hypothetical protein
MPNPYHLLEPFPQIIVAMIAGMVFKARKHLIPMFLTEPWCLEVVGVEDHVLTATGSLFLLCCLEEWGPYPLSPKALTLSSRFAGRTRNTTRAKPHEFFDQTGGSRQSSGEFGW